MTHRFATLSQNAGAFYESTSTAGGVVWASTRDAGEAARLRTQLTPGLHISCGVADIQTTSTDLGGFETKQPVLTAILVPEDGACFDTRLGAGYARSFGLHIEDIDALSQDACLGVIVSVLRGKPMTVVGGHAACRTTKLATPVDPWFQGDARNLVLQSRALELIAVAMEAVADTPRASLRSRDLVRAQAVKDLIEQDLSQSFRLYELARQNAVDVRLMTAAFRRVCGESIGQYIQRRRMEEAARLVSEGASVKSAATKLGYTPNALSTAFRRHFGHPPIR